MKAVNPGLLFAIGSMVFMGISSYLYKRSTDALGATNTTFYYYLFSIIIATGVWLVFRERNDFPKSALMWPLLIAVFLFLSVWLFNLSLQYLDVSLAATIRGMFFVVTLLLALIISKEQPTPLSFLAVGLAVTSVVLIGIDSASK